MTATRVVTFITAFTAIVNPVFAPAFAQGKTTANTKPDSCHVLIVKTRSDAVTDKDTIAKLYSITRYMVDPQEDIGNPDKKNRIVEQLVDEINHRGEALSQSIADNAGRMVMHALSLPKANDPTSKELTEELAKAMKDLSDHRATDRYYLEADCIQPMRDAYEKLKNGEAGSYRPALLGTAERIPGITTFTFKPNALQQ